MKKIVKLSLLCFFIILLANTIFAKWIYSEKAKGWLYLDETSNSFVKNQWFMIDINDQMQRIYYFNENGFLLPNATLPDGKKTNAKGEYIENGIVVDVPKALGQMQTQITQKSSNKKQDTQVINTTGKEIKNYTAGSNIINTKNKDVNDEDNNVSGRLLKNYIKDKQNIEILKEKSINGVKKNNVIYFKDNGSFISLNTKKYNKVSLTIEREKITSDDVFELHLVVNGEEEVVEQFEEDEYLINTEFKYNLNDEVDLVFYTNGQSSSWNKRGIYITSGRMGKHNEEDE